MPVRLGVIGCGKIYGTHCDAIGGIDGAELTAVYDIIPDRTAEAAGAYRAHGAANLADLWEHVDAVTICVPSGLHAEVGIEAARAGKHVLVEKPVDVSLEAAQRLVDECRQCGVKMGTVSQHRFARKMRKLHDAAQANELGPLVQGDAYIKWYRTQAYYDSGDWRGTWALDGGGCLMNQGVHYVDMIQWIMGGVKAVQAQVRTAAHSIEVEDTAMALVEYRNGAVGVIQGSTSCYPGFAERLEVHGRHGSVILEGDRIKFWDIDPEGAEAGFYGGGVMMQPTPSRHTHEMQPDEENARDTSANWGEQHRLQIEDFVRSIEEDREPFITGEMSLEPLKVILAIYESARDGGRRVEIA
ncbi:MAG TPA: Gfo/Idh/MocA family oxidoreductase [Fimbriimonas sp.]